MPLLLSALALSSCGSHLDLQATDVPAMGRGTPLPIPTNHWHPGDPSDQALTGGVLAVTPAGCLVAVRQPGGTGVLIIWPAGWTAERFPDGVKVLRPGRSVAVSEGERFSGGGSATGVTSAKAPCPGHGAFSLDDDLRRR